jgi:hypothetical protein
MTSRRMRSWSWNGTWRECWVSFICVFLFSFFFFCFNLGPYSPLSSLADIFARMIGQPSAFRQPLLDRQAAIIDAILAREHDSSFHKAKVDEMASTLLANLQPLLNRLANPADAYRDMAQVAERGRCRRASSRLGSRLTFGSPRLAAASQVSPCCPSGRTWTLLSCRPNTGASRSSRRR